EARRGLLVLWNVYAFLVTYARLAGWQPAAASDAAAWTTDRSGAPLDRWIRSRMAGLAAEVEDRLADTDPYGASRLLETFIDDLSTWYLRLSRKRFSRNPDAADRDAAFATLQGVVVALAQVLAPILPFLTEAMFRNLASDDADASVHLTRWPTERLAPAR